jgi:hypothetical protein
MNGIYWLSSYPKSGNTWMRVFLNNYLKKSAEPIDINRLERTPLINVRDFFDDALIVESGLLSLDEIDALRPAFYRRYILSRKQISEHLCKIHDGFQLLPDSSPIFPADATAGVIYILRNPLDVAISYANHSQIDIDTSIEWMNDETHALSLYPNMQPPQLHQRMFSWSSHVRGWVDQTYLPVHIVRYEDMIASTKATFEAVIRFIGWDVDEENLERSIRFSSFEEVKRQESEHGFNEKPKSVKNFFRKGKAGDWRDTLTPEQIERIIRDHGELMVRFGYLPLPDANA